MHWCKATDVVKRVDSCTESAGLCRDCTCGAGCRAYRTPTAASLHANQPCSGICPSSSTCPHQHDFKPPVFSESCCQRALHCKRLGTTPLPQLPTTESLRRPHAGLVRVLSPLCSQMRLVAKLSMLKLIHSGEVQGYLEAHLVCGQLLLLTQH